MKLALKFIDNNPHPRCGIFIKHASPKVWLQEIKRMQLQLSDCTAYVCPGTEANSISGILLILKTAQKSIDIGNNITIQKAHKDFFIPENTTLNMALTDEEFSKLLNGTPHFFHHEFGMIELSEALNWSTIIQNPQEQFPAIETPAKSVKIPRQVHSLSIEIEEAEEAETLENPFGSEEVDLKDVPFDMKKVLEGNNAEVAKYLNYLDKNPNAALKMAIPLDMMGTSRGKAFAKYKFKSNFFESLGFGNSSHKSDNFLRSVLAVVVIVAMFWFGYEIIKETKNNHTTNEVVYPDIETETELTNETETVSGKDENSEINTTNLDLDAETTQLNQQETQPLNTKSNGIQNILLIIAILVLLLLIRYLMRYQKQEVLNNQLEKKQSWLDLPDESEFFDIQQEEEENKRYKESQSIFYFGGNEISIQNKIILCILIIGLLIYLFYPLFTKEGFPVVYGIVTGFIVLRMSYTLLNKNQTFDEEDA